MDVSVAQDDYVGIGIGFLCRLGQWGVYSRGKKRDGAPLSILYTLLTLTPTVAFLKRKSENRPMLLTLTDPRSLLTTPTPPTLAETTSKQPTFRRNHARCLPNVAGRLK